MSALKWGKLLMELMYSVWILAPNKAFTRVYTLDSMRWYISKSKSLPFFMMVKDSYLYLLLSVPFPVVVYVIVYVHEELEAYPCLDQVPHYIFNTR